MTATEMDRLNLLSAADWDGLRAKILSGLKRLGRDIPIIRERDEEQGWILVEERLPQVEGEWRRCSENVRILLKSGNVVTGYYETESGTWYNYNTGKRIANEKVYAWMEDDNADL